MILKTITGILAIGRGALRPGYCDQCMPRGDVGAGNFALLLDDGSPADMSGGALVLTVSGLFARQLTFDSAPDGTATYPIVTADTWFGQDNAGYRMDVVFIDNAGRYGAAGGRYQVLAPSMFYLGAAIATGNPPVANPIPPQPILAGSLLMFRYTVVQPRDGSDFFVPLPAARTNNNYTAAGWLTSGSDFVNVDCVNLAPGDVTNTQFHVLTSGELNNGDIITFWVNG